MTTREFGHHIQLNHKPSVSILHKERHLQTLLNAPAVIFSESFSLASKYTLSILDQGNLGSCVVNAFAGIMQSLYNTNYSRLYFYFNARVGTGNSPIDDSGLDLLQSIPILTSFGLVPETNWPYDISKFYKIPSFPNTYKIADTRPITYSNITQSETAIKTALAANKFVIFGMIIYTSFMTTQVKKTGIIPVPNIKKEQNLGGHCLHIIGWCKFNNTAYFIIRNSWGKTWGNNGSVIPNTNFVNNGTNGGFGYIPVAYILNPLLAFEFIAIG
jgi:C1A family cysteine protease